MISRALLDRGVLRAAALLALGAASLVGCDASTGGAASPGIQSAQSGPGGPPFLDRIATAPMTVSYGGKRHVRVDYSDAGAPAVLDYEEQVWSDGHGRFAIVPGDVARPHMTTEQLDLFTTLQQARDGFFYRYRDFRIRDLALFLQNWRLIDTGRQEVVAGVTTSVLEFHRIDGSPTWYRAWIDPQTALVMKAEERSTGDRLLSLVEFVQFQLAPDTTGLGLEDDQFLRTPFDPQSNTVAQLGFQIRPPTLLPDGYRLERAESTSDGTHTWAILTYTDGVDSMFFLQSVDPQTAGGQTPPGEYDVGRKVARGFHFGPWTVLQVRSDADRMVVLGKAESLGIERMLKSSIH